MTIRAAVFDLDGTLADTLGDIAASLNHALSRHDLPTHDRATYSGLVGEGVGRLVARALPADRQDAYDAVMADLADHYMAHMLDSTTPYDGIPEMLDDVAARGLPMAVHSNKPEPATRAIVERLFPDREFTAVLGHADGMPLKPDPAGALAIAARMGVDPAECVYLGDTRTDMQTATAAGMIPVGALWGFRDRQELEAYGARVVLDHPARFVDLL